jgi:alginate production protein
MGQAVTSTDIIETDTLQQSDGAPATSNNDRKTKKNYLAMREFWVGYSGLTPYPGEILKFGRQRLRNDDGQWRDTNIEALNWTFDTTLLQGQRRRRRTLQRIPHRPQRAGAQGQGSPARLRRRAYQWTPGQWVGIRGHHTHDDGKLDYPEPGVASDSLDKPKTATSAGSA